MSRTMRLVVSLECDNSQCGADGEQEVDDFCGDSSQVPDAGDIDWRGNADGEVFCDGCISLARKILDE